MARRSNGTRRRVAATTLSDKSAGETIEEITADIKTIVQEGGARSTGTVLNYRRHAAQFDKWLSGTLGVHVEQLNPVPGDLLVLWALELVATIKPRTARAYVTNAIAGLAAAGHTVTKIDAAKALVANITGQTRKSLPMTDPRVDTRKARPFTAKVLWKLRKAIAEVRHNPGGLAERWLLRLDATLVFAYIFSLRISEVLDGCWGWLDVGPVTDGQRVVSLTIPHSKYQPEPETVRSLIDVDSWSVIEEWRVSQQTVGAPVGPDDRIFLETTKYRTLPYRDVIPPRCVAGKTLADFTDVAAELVDDLDPASIAAGSVKRLRWRCSVCGCQLERPVRTHTRTPGCRSCADRKKYFEGLGTAQSSPAAGHEWIDLIALYIADEDDTHPDLTKSERHVLGRNKEALAYRKALKWICKKAGVEPRDKFEYIGTHGARRGHATDIIAAGGTIFDVGAHLRHRKVTETTRGYTSQKDSPLPNPLRLLDEFPDTPGSSDL